MSEKNTRIAIVNHDKCKPKKCRQECKKSCPVVRMGKLCIEVTAQSKIVWISESLCIGCGICIKVKSPVGLISMNVCFSLESMDCTCAIFHSRLPIPRPGEVLGLVGTNGIGKSTALKILAGKQKPNLGKYDAPPDWQEILTYFRGSELQNYFTKILEDDLKAIVKPQYVDQIPKTVKGTVGSILSRKDDSKTETIVCEQLDLTHLRERNVEDLSGGELQRFAIAVVCIQRADIFMFDEPSSYLDVKQRLRAAVTIRSLISPDRSVALHDALTRELREVPILNVSYKPQKISPKFKGSVRALLHEKIRDAYTHPQFVTDVMKPMQIESIIDQDVQNLSGGELQRVAMALCLGKPADVYLIDEPSAYLDSEQRLVCAKVIKRFILHAKKTAFVVEHDFIMATYLADRVIVFDGIPSRSTAANTPQTLLAGMNKFLSQLEITFRRDPNNFRPRINKMNSIKVQGSYFCVLCYN
uniref:ATP-binding cassette, sub-family E (OABP), member 1 n=1 Tax=Oncorhynchus kisutch TaxID=8019 RepID=A0A8C7HUZ8_ONCKI